MDSKIIHIFVNGILTWPGESDNWTGKAVTWCHTETAVMMPAEKVEYFSGALFSRSIGQQARAEKLRKTLQRYLNKGWKVVLAGHSNGCDVILDALRDMDYPQIEALHLVAAACEADFDKNGLNNARVGFVKVYCGGEDAALKIADTWAGRLFGYGALGKTGPINAKVPVEIIRVSHYGHSDWFSCANFSDTMAMLTK